MHPAWLAKKLKNNLVKCLACNHYCKILPEKAGICAVRQNRAGELYSLVYAKPVSVNIDPIEKKPLYHFLPGTEIFSLGTLGCNFKCSFCQNWSISQTDLENVKNWASAESWPPKKIIGYCLQNSIPSIAYTYNEPTVFFEYAYDTAKLARKAGLYNVWVSNGYFSDEALKKITPFVDAMNIDLKSFNPEFYKKICNGKLEVILKNIQAVYKNKILLELTSLIIPGENDQEKELKNMAEFIKSIDQNIPWHLSAFFPNYKMQDNLPTAQEKLEQAYQIAREAGLNYVYLGNLGDEKHSQTICPKCKALLIKRKNDLGVEIFLDQQGKCKKCGLKIQGIWSNFNKNC